MRFWDSSAVVPMLINQTSSETTRGVHAQDREMLVWWGTEIECVSAIARHERAGDLTPDVVAASLERLDAMVKVWTEIEPTTSIRRTAKRLLRTHDLRGGDALQLAAAIQGTEGYASGLPFVSQDGKLNEAAQREGFSVIDPRAV